MDTKKQNRSVSSYFGMDNGLEKPWIDEHNIKNMRSFEDTNTSNTSDRFSAHLEARYTQV